MNESGNGAAKQPILAHKKKRDRSPAYPGIDLKEVISKAEILYKEEGKHKAPVNVVLDHWGYKPKSGGGLVALAALKKFGLLDDEGTGENRMAGLSASALAILMDEDPDSAERQRLIKEAALKPTIHAELWREYEGKLPSDGTMRTRLKMHRGFTERGATEFIPQFKSTIAFAKLAESDTLSDDDEDKDGVMDDERNAGGGISTAERKKPQGTRTFNVPLSPTQSVVIQMPATMDERSWDLWLAVINAMKPGIVGEDEGSPE